MTNSPDQEHMQPQAMPSSSTQPNPAASTQAPSSGLAIAGLVLGILAFLLSFIPFLNLGSVVIGLLGLVLAIIGLVGTRNGKRRGKGSAIAGIVLCILAMSVVFAMYGGAASSSSSSQSSRTASAGTTASATNTTSSASVTSTSTSENTQEASSSQSTAAQEEPATLTYGSSFEFDDLTITLGTGAWTTTLDNQFASHSGEAVVVLPVNIINNKSESGGFNMFYLTEYGSKGTELDSVFTYFDDDVRMMGNVRPGATLEGNFYFLYDGDGTYYLEFATLFESPVEVELPVRL